MTAEIRLDRIGVPVSLTPPDANLIVDSLE